MVKSCEPNNATSDVSSGNLGVSIANYDEKDFFLVI